MMKKTYIIINIIVLTIAIVFFWDFLRTVDINVQNGFCLNIGLIVLTVIAVHFLKSLRLYFELFEQQMSSSMLFRQYCKVVPVSIVLPWKVGDVFRVYCFGYCLKDYMLGAAVILLDRFVDTLALITTVLLICLIKGAIVPEICYSLAFFLGIMYLFYLLCPGMCRYWNEYFIRAKASNQSLKALSFIMNVKRVYGDIKAIADGKFFLTYLLSVLAWLVEIGGLLVSVTLIKEPGLKVVQEYFMHALAGGHYIYLDRFIVASVILLFCLYVIICINGRHRKVNKL